MVAPGGSGIVRRKSGVRNGDVGLFADARWLFLFHDNIANADSTWMTVRFPTISRDTVDEHHLFFHRGAALHRSAQCRRLCAHPRSRRSPLTVVPNPTHSLFFVHVGSRPTDPVDMT